MIIAINWTENVDKMTIATMSTGNNTLSEIFLSPSGWKKSPLSHNFELAANDEDRINEEDKN